MEDISTLKRLSILFFIALALFGSGCTSKKVMQESEVRFKDINDEYAKVVKIGNVTSNAPKSEKSSNTKIAAAKKKFKHHYIRHRHIVRKKWLHKKGKRVETAEEKEVHLPKLEDSEGFIGRRPKVDPFRVNEKIVLAVSYFNVVAGDLTLEVLPFKMVNGHKAYDFAITVKSNKIFSLFYAVLDRGETFVDFDTLTPITYSIVAKETARQKETKVYFDPETDEATLWEKVIERKDNEEKKRKVTWKLNPFTQNVISAIYYLRTFTLRPGKKLAFRVSDDGKNYVFNGQVLRREKITTDAGDFNTLVVKPTFHLEGKFQQTGENYIWLTDDDRKLPVRIESKIKIGSLVAKLKSISYGDNQAAP